MSSSWQQLLYPLGFLPGIFFGGRFIYQWLLSESIQKSVVTTLFWRLSIIGNTLLLLHALIQSQYHVATVQTVNAVISWRNLNLMNDKKRVSLNTTIIIMVTCVAAITLFFLFQNMFTLGHESVWFRIPKGIWWNKEEKSVSLIWHMMGIIGLILFASRFWVQWIQSEFEKKSILGSSFWWLSLIGSILCLTYFIHIKDPVNFIGPLFGLVPYLRNLMLIRKTKLSEAKL